MRPLRLLIAAGLAAVAAGCGPDEPPVPPEPTAESVTFGLFDLARQPDPDEELLAVTFGPVKNERELAALLDAVRELRFVESVEIVDRYTLEQGARIGFDLEGPVGAGTARYSVLLDAEVPPGKIVWFSGPGVEWPERRRRDSGTTTSAPPRPAEEG